MRIPPGRRYYPALGRATGQKRPGGFVHEKNFENPHFVSLNYLGKLGLLANVKVRDNGK